MAIGDQAADLQVILPTEFLTVRPGVGAEWRISNIFFNGATQLFFSDGSASCLIATYLGSGRWAGVEFIVSNDFFLKIKNSSAVSKYIGFVGEVTK